MQEPERRASDVARRDRHSLLPAEYAGDSVEALAAENTVGTGFYLFVLALLAAICASLPFVRIPITVQSTGVLRPVVERHEVRAHGHGVVKRIAVSPGDSVRPGEDLVTIEGYGIDIRAGALRTEREQLERQVRDLVRLTRSTPGVVISPTLETGRYRRSYAGHRQAVDLHEARIAFAETELRRAEQLVARGVAPRSAVDELSHRRDQETSALAILHENARSGWEAELAELLARVRAIRTQEEALEVERGSMNLAAPVRGTIEQLAAISPGSAVRAGELIAVISPDTTLVGIVAADDRVAALVEPGDSVRLDLAAFPASEWGYLPATVLETPVDAAPVEGAPVYPLRVALLRDHLALPGGRRGELRKGMGFRAGFRVAERSLWAILRDGVNDRMDPGRNPSPR